MTHLRPVAHWIAAIPPHVAPSAPSFGPLAEVEDAGAVVATGADEAEDCVAGADDAAGVALADAFVGVVAVV